MIVGFAQQRALIRYHFKHNPRSIDEMAEYWGDFKYLVSTKQIPMAQIPLEFK